MNRIITSKIKHWYDHNDESILCICGGHGVGKTWVAREFCREYDKDYIYISVKNTKEEDIEDTISCSAVFLIIDDINDKILYDKARRIVLKIRSDMALSDYKVIFIGTEYLANKIGQNDNGYMTLLHMTPLNLCEFSMALKSKWNEKEYFNMTERDIFNIYLMVGGMPECVELFLENGDFTSVRCRQCEILSNICYKLSGNVDVIKTKEWQIINAIFIQEITASAGFSLRQVNKSARNREYKESIERLCGAGIIYRLNRMDNRTSNRIKDYKLYVLDVGLAGAVAAIDERSIMDNDIVWNQYKGYLLKNFIIQEYYSYYYGAGWELRYWHKARAKARLPFVFVNLWTDCIWVIDIENMWRKSIASFAAEYLDANRQNMTIQEITERALEHNIL